MFDELLDLFDRDRKRSTGERRRGFGGLIDRLSGDARDDVRSNQRRSDDHDDERYDTRSDRGRTDDRDDDRGDDRGRRRRETEFWDD